MHILAPAQQQVGSLVWRPSPGRWRFTVIAKDTFRLVPGEATLAETQEPFYPADQHVDRLPNRSVHVPADLAPAKGRVDVVLVGSAYGPSGRTVRSVRTRLVVGEIDKSIDVYGDRAWMQTGALFEGPALNRLSLRYERGAGGPGTSNPVGIRSNAPPDARGIIPVAALLPAGMVVERPGQEVPSTGYGPLGATWPERFARLGPRGLAGVVLGDEPLDEGVDISYFNVAPVDQQTELLRDDEQLMLEGLHAQHERLVTCLPGVRPSVYLARPGAEPIAVSMRCDTLWIDTDRALLTLTWRGAVNLATRDEEGRVYIARTQRGERLGAQDVIARVERASVDVRATPVTAPTALLSLDRPGINLPTAPNAPPAVRLPAISQTVFADSALPTPALPFASGAVPPPRIAALESPPHSPWARPSSPGAEPLPIAPPAPMIAPPVAWLPPPAPLTHAPAIASAASLSNAAAFMASGDASTAPRGLARSGSQGAIQLVWYDAKIAPRLRRHDTFAAVFAESDLGDGDLDAVSTSVDVEEAGDARDVHEVLIRAESIAPGLISDASAGAIRPNGAFVPPLVVLRGVLVIPFDETATLEVLIALGAALVGGDAAIKEAMEAARAVAALPAPIPPSLADEASQRLQQAFDRARRQIGGLAVDAHAERALLARRAYSRRTVLGKEHLRTLLTDETGSVLVAVYLPEHLAKELPMFTRFSVRILGELLPTQDQAEAHPWAVRGLALGREFVEPR